MSVRIGRREFVSLLVAVAAAWRRAARAQQPDRVRRIGALWALAEDDPEFKARVTEFRRALEQLGWLENDNIRIDERFAAGRADQLPPLAKELVAPATGCDRRPIDAGRCGVATRDAHDPHRVCCRL